MATKPKTKTPAAQAPDATPPAEPLVDVSNLFDELAVPAWKRVGLIRAMSWAQGKRVTRTELQTALDAWLSRPLGR